MAVQPTTNPPTSKPQLRDSWRTSVSRTITVNEEAVERAARGIWTATGHRESDWAYIAPEGPRKQRYMAYARAALEAAAE